MLCFVLFNIECHTYKVHSILNTSTTFHLLKSNSLSYSGELT